MTEPTKDIAAKLQHPRRSLGNRHRSQAEKFLSLSETDSSNLLWAEQSARQAVLHDFTNPDNWRVLVRIKLNVGDYAGIHAVLNDLFAVLGRDPVYLTQLEGVDMSESGMGILEAALVADPLDPDDWWNGISSDEGSILSFIERVGMLDMTDHRANILFSRRLERLRDSGREEDYLKLARVLLAQRPSNHEAWSALGRMHERRGEYDQAWLCYDQAQSNFPEFLVRDQFRERMEAKMDGRAPTPWKVPEVTQRVEFLKRMQKLSMSPSNDVRDDLVPDISSNTDIFGEVAHLRSEGRSSEAFFLARRMAAEGIDGALELVEEIRMEIGDE
jgi:tetratricopeptide (TPR) repeat protein